MRRKKSDAQKPTTGKERLADFIFINSWYTNKASKDFIELLAGRMLEYFAQPDKLSVKEFLADSGITWHSFCGWVKENEVLGQVYAQVKLMLAARREKGMLLKNIDPRVGMYCQHAVDEEWDGMDKRWSEMKKIERENANYEQKVIYIETLEDSTGRKIVRRMIEERPIDDKEDDSEGK